MSKSNLSGEDFMNWASSLGFTSSIPPEAFNKLLTPQMTPFWRHVMQHVKRKEEVERIRKNLLLHELKQSKDSQKHHQKLPIRVGKISQLAVAETHEKLVKKLEKSSAEIKSSLEQIEKLNLALKKKGKEKKEISQTIEKKTTKLQLLKQKEKHFNKVLDLKSLIPPMEALQLPANTEQSWPNCSAFAANTKNPSTEEKNMIDELEDLEHLLESKDSRKMIVLNDARTLCGTKDHREDIRNHLRAHFSSVLPKITMNALTMKLRQLSHDLARAAVSASDAEELDEFKNELEIRGIKDLDVALKDEWKSLVAADDELDLKRRSVTLKQQKLNDAKKLVLEILLKNTNGNYEDELIKWIDLSVRDTIMKEKIRVLDGCNNQILEELKNLEDSMYLFENINQSIQTCEYKVKSSTRLLQRNLSSIEVNGLLNQTDRLKQKFIQKIKDFQIRTTSLNKCNPILCLQDFISSEVTSLMEAPLEVFKISANQNLNSECLPLLPMYTPYYPKHLIIQDTVERMCWRYHSLKTLEELIPSPPLDVDISDLLLSIATKEDKTNSALEHRVSEVIQTFNNGKQLLQQTAESISCWIEWPRGELIPNDLICEGYNFESFKSKILDSLEGEK